MLLLLHVLARHEMVPLLLRVLDRYETLALLLHVLSRQEIIQAARIGEGAPVHNLYLMALSR
jgi:hypothetical protein